MNTTTQAVDVTGPQPAPLATCPLCHTVESSVSDAELTGGASWRCQSCGLRWDAERLATVAAYAARA